MCLYLKLINQNWKRSFFAFQRLERFRFKEFFLIEMQFNELEVTFEN